MRKASGAVVIAAVAALAGLTGCESIGTDDKTSTHERSFDFTGKSLTIDAATTDVRIVTGSEGTIGVEAQLTGKADNKGNAETSLDGSTLKIKVECSGISVNCKALHIVKLPSDVAVKVKNTNGAVRVVDFPGSVDANVNNGWVKVEQPSGSLRLKASYAVTVEGARSSKVEATSTDRNVSLAFTSAPEDVKATAFGSSVKVQLPKGSETYQLNLIGTDKNKGNVTDDPRSKRSISATVRSGSVDVRTAG